MSLFVGTLVRAYSLVFLSLQRLAEGWFLGLAARFVFAAVLLVYFWNSALTKLGAGPFGFLSPSVGAYAQILPKMMESVGYDVSAIPFFPYGLIVLLGTWAEFILPIAVTLGLFTRLSSLAMIGFIVVMSVVDITGHGADAATIGAWFDRVSDAAILDQRLLWAFPLTYLILRGPGVISLDWVFGRMYRRRIADR